MGQLNSSLLKFCLSQLKQISQELEFGSTQFLATLTNTLLGLDYFDEKAKCYGRLFEFC